MTGDDLDDLIIASWDNAVWCLNGYDGGTLWRTQVGSENGGDVWTVHAIGDVNHQCLNRGDVNDDAVITPEDALMCFQIYLQIMPDPSEHQSCAADCNGSEMITPEDARCIFVHYISGDCNCLDPLQYY